MRPLAANLNRGDAAERLSVHSNTVHDRLNCIAKLSGGDHPHLSELIELVTAATLLARDTGRAG